MSNAVNVVYLQTNRSAKKQAKRKRREAKKCITLKEGQYTIQDIRRGLQGMILGKSRREMEEYTRVPSTNLRRHFLSLVGRAPNTKIPLTKEEQKKFLPLAENYLPKGRGDGMRYFTLDEEEMFVITIEEAHAAAFPYDADTVERMASTAGKGVYGKSFKVGRKWRIGFEKRWAHRLTKVKCSSIDRARGKKATSEVRDAVFKNF